MSSNLPEEITLRDIFLLIGDYVRYFLKHWYLFLSLVVLFVSWFIWGAFTEPGTYTAKLRFSLNEDRNGGGSGISSVLGKYGLGGNGSGPNYLKLSEVASSSSVLNRLLFDSVSNDYDTVLVANLLIDLYNHHENWADSEELKGFIFTKANPSQFTRTEKRAMKYLQKQLRGLADAGFDGLCQFEFNAESGIVEMKVETVSEMLSIQLAYNWYEELSKLYIMQTVAPKEKTLEVIEDKVDSIRNVLNLLQIRYARLQDRRTGIILQGNLTEQERVQRELSLNQIIYAEAVKNQEQSRFILANQIPAFTIIEEPGEPIMIDRPSFIMSAVKGIVTGFLLAIVFLFSRKLYRDTLNNN